MKSSISGIISLSNLLEDYNLWTMLSIVSLIISLSNLLEDYNNRSVAMHA